MLSVAERGEVKSRDRSRGEEEHREQRALLVATAQRRHHGARDEDEPEHEAGREADLPEATEIDVLVPAVTEPEPCLAEVPLHAEPFARKRAHRDEDERAEQDVHAEPLEARLVTDGGPDVEPRREPRGRDPEDADLEVPGSGDRVRKVFRERDAVEGGALHAVVRDDHAHHDLHEEERRGQPEELHDGALRWRGARREERIGRRRARHRLVVLAPPDGVPCRHRSDTAEEHQDAHAAPDDRGPRGVIADERLVRPVVRVRNGLVRPVRHRRPCAPEEERGDRPSLRGIAERVLRDGVRVATVREHVRVVARARVEGCGADGLDRQRAGRGVVTGALHLIGQPPRKTGASLLVEILPGASVLGA